MTSVRLEFELRTLEPAGDVVYVEGHAGGSQVALYLSTTAAAQLGPLTIGQRLALTLEPAPQAAPPPLRERMQRPVAAASRSAAPAAPPSRSDGSAAIMAAIFDGPKGEGAVQRDIDDEMDALLGRMKRGR